MKKLFFAICFNIIVIGPAIGRVTPISGYENIKPQVISNASPEVKEIGYDEFKKIIKDGLSDAKRVNKETINKNMGFVASARAQYQKSENQKSIFEKIYDQAMSRIQKTSEPVRNDIIPEFSHVETIESQEKNWNKVGFPTITAMLPPDYTPFVIPAMEHIPYLMNSIEVLPNGLVKFEETITVVANKEKLSRGLTKILPLKTISPQGQSQKIDYTIVSVTVNDTPIEYRLTSDAKNALLVPKRDYKLSPGIYTYRFEYLADNLLWKYKDFYRLYWDVGGNGWNLVVDRLGASLSLPKTNSLLNNGVLLGGPSMLNADMVEIKPNGPAATAYIAQRPLFIGEGMHLVADIAPQAIFAETFWHRVIRSFYNNGDIWLSLLGFIVVATSFIVSWFYISGNKKQNKMVLNKTAAVIRYLLFNRFDKKTVCGFLLELYKKNIIDIQQSGDTILLIKRTDNLKSLNGFEQDALKQIFPQHETVFNVNKNNKLPLKRFAAKLDKGLKKQMLRFKMKLNIGYIFFSVSMLFFTEFCIAAFNINFGRVFAILSVCTFLSFLGVFLLLQGKKIWQKIICRFAGIDILLPVMVVFSAVVNPFSAVLIIATVAITVVALRIYSQRLGLIKQYVKDINDYKDHILKNHDNIVIGRNFINYQAAIWAFDIQDDFVPTGNPEYYKIPAMEQIVKYL